MPRKKLASPVAPIDAPRVDGERIVPLVPPVKKAAPTSPAPPSTKSAVKKPHRRTPSPVEDATSPRTIARRHIEEILAIWGVTLSKAQKRSAIDKLIRHASRPVTALKAHEASAAVNEVAPTPPPPVIQRLFDARFAIEQALKQLAY